MSKYTTGELAKLCNVTVRTVQYYDSRGILVPSGLSEGGRRLYSEDDLTVNGEGALTVTSAKGHGLVAKDELTLVSGTLDITAEGHAIQAKDSLAVKDGTYKLTGGSDGVHVEHDSDGQKGFAYVAGGTWTIDAGSDGFDTSNDLLVDGGSITVSADDDGLHSEYDLIINAGTIRVADSYEGFCDTLEQVLTLSPENITVHTLSLKKGSRILTEGTELPDAAAVGQMLDFAEEKLRAAGYEPYYLYRQKFMSGGFENIGWAKPGAVNLYNICIMEELCTILAMGAGGSTKLVRRDGGRNLRFIAPKYPLEYIGGIDGLCAEKKKIETFYREWED